jgi:biotin carboxylase
MISKKLLFIGAGPSQSAGIKKAKDLGHYVISIDENPKSEGFLYSDKYFIMSIFDYDAIISLAKKHGIDAALSVSSDVCLEAVSVVNEAISHPSLTKDQVKLATNKGQMRQKLSVSNNLCPKFFLCKSLEDIEAVLHLISTPVVVKPVDSSGSRGVLYIDDKSDLVKLSEQVFSFSKTNEIIIEEFMEGLEVAVEAFIIDGNLFVLCISDKVRTSPPFLLDTTVIFPSSQPKDVLREIRNSLEEALKHLEFDNTPIHAEIIITNEGPKIVEIATRGAGFKVFTKIIPYVTGVDSLMVQIKLLLGESIEIQHIENNAACLKFFSGSEGVLKSVSGLDRINENSSLEEIEIYPKIGDKINNLESGGDRIGHIITFSKNRNQALTEANKIYNSVHIEIA